MDPISAALADYLICSRGLSNHEQHTPHKHRQAAIIRPLGMITMLNTLAASDLSIYLPVLLLLTMAILFAIGNLAASAFLGPSRSGRVKDATYESGMNPIGTARKRFNVRFYLIAMVFLVFDIEIIFLYPWAVTFPSLDQTLADGGVWLGRIGFFLATSIVAYIYGYRKGVFRFD